MNKNLFFILNFIICMNSFSQTGRQIIGSGPLTTLPGRPQAEHIVMNQDIAHAAPGDYFWRKTNDGKFIDISGKKWGWLYINQGDINWAREHDIMKGFTPKLPDIDESGDKFIEYSKNQNYSRKLYDKGTIEDIITQQAEFDKALSEIRKIYPNPIPRKNNKITGATNWFYLDDVNKNFPNTFWASITSEGRIMKVIIANGPAHRLAVSYWADDSFMKEFPRACWSWKGEDETIGKNAQKIQEDASQTAVLYETK